MEKKQLHICQREGRDCSTIPFAVLSSLFAEAVEVSEVMC